MFISDGLAHWNAQKILRFSDKLIFFYFFRLILWHAYHWSFKKYGRVVGTLKNGSSSLFLIFLGLITISSDSSEDYDSSDGYF